jgi:hypothetical protein
MDPRERRARTRCDGRGEEHEDFEAWHAGRGCGHQLDGLGRTRDACYRTHCGKSIAGQEGKCGGTLAAGLRDENSCEIAGGDWTTADRGEQYKKKPHG